MRVRKTKFDQRKNPDSSRVYGLRLAVSPSLELVGANGSPPERAEMSPPEQRQTEVFDLPPTEPFASADEAAEFLSIRRRYLLELARRGIAGAYALGTGSKRNIWVFRLSELAASVVRQETRITKPPKTCSIRDGSPR
jgi:hypothetical protein